jgi:hypothetical protein
VCMKMLVACAVSLSLLGAAWAADSSDAQTVSRLAQSKLTLADGIRHAATAHGAPISAKFEFEDGKLWLSVYTAKAGIGPDAEHNSLIELKGQPDQGAWQPGIEVFEDKEHLARSAMHLTLLQQSKLDLAALVERAASMHKGRPYSAIPAVKNGKPILVVKLAETNGSSHSVDIPL